MTRASQTSRRPPERATSSFSLQKSTSTPAVALVLSSRPTPSSPPRPVPPHAQAHAVTITGGRVRVPPPRPSARALRHHHRGRPWLSLLLSHLTFSRCCLHHFFSRRSPPRPPPLPTLTPKRTRSMRRASHYRCRAPAWAHLAPNMIFRPRSPSPPPATRTQGQSCARSQPPHRPRLHLRPRGPRPGAQKPGASSPSPHPHLSPWLRTRATQQPAIVAAASRCSPKLTHRP
ncbi:hypothetical protein BKA62DRAFT_721109, partial [Auriculariales sp. MPI-PUGE-AT-0066]